MNKQIKNALIIIGTIADIYSITKAFKTEKLNQISMISLLHNEWFQFFIFITVCIIILIVYSFLSDLKKQIASHNEIINKQQHQIAAMEDKNKKLTENQKLLIEYADILREDAAEIENYRHIWYKKAIDYLFETFKNAGVEYNFVHPITKEEDRLHDERATNRDELLTKIRKELDHEFNRDKQ